ncbi:MAG: hypothetical protein N5P05_001440 [Chroococcopsis gigantea SAG 12.99]|nr:hypothetical protein [Chroococcopsis gigantea SAG 12.99]
MAGEFSIVSVRRSRISHLVEEGDLQAQTVQRLQRTIERLLSTTQLGITLSSLALGWIGESTMAVFLQEVFVNLPVSQLWRISLTHSISIPLAFLLIAYFQIVLGELVPKSLALIYPEQLARVLAGPVGVISKIFNPFIFILNQSTRYLLGIFKIKHPDSHLYNRVTSEELRLIISTERESIGLEAEEREILNNVFQFGEVTAKEIMIPRNRIVSISDTACFQDLLAQVTKTDFSRYPVRGDSLDDVLGIIDFKDLALPMAAGQLTPHTAIEAWVKPVRFFPESTSLSELLGVMQRSQLKMIMVVDEYGGTAGLITIEDLIGEILGTKSQDDESENFEIKIVDEQTYLIQAQMNVEAINDICDLNLPIIDEYQTLGGFIQYQWQRIPPIGEKLNYDDLEFTIMSAQGPRLGHVRIHRRESIEPSL